MDNPHSKVHRVEIFFTDTTYLSKKGIYFVTVQCYNYSMPVKEYIAYKGQEFQIEWYYAPKGENQALEYYRKLTPADRRKVLRLFRMMGEIGKIRDETKFRYEGDKVYAFKPQPHRFLSFFVEGKKIIVTNAFRKKQQKLPPGEKNRALKCMESYKTRVKEGTYYGKEE